MNNELIAYFMNAKITIFIQKYERNSIKSNI